MKEFTVLVCGGRDYADAKRLTQVLNGVREKHLGCLRLVMGDAGGADALASAWSLVYGIPNRRYVAKWGKHGRAAGPIRNQQMLDENSVDLVIAFSGGKGTADMVGRAEAAGIEVRRISDP